MRTLWALGSDATASNASAYASRGNRWVMMPAVLARPVRSARMAAANDVISANDPLIVISRRKTSKGWNRTTSSERVTP